MAAFLFVLALTVFVAPTLGLLAFTERKISADLQARIGPNRVGIAGALQPIADLLKLLQKNDKIGLSWQARVLRLSQIFLLFSMLAGAPLGSAFLLTHSESTVLVPLFSALCLVFISLLFHSGFGSLEGLLSTLRWAAQVMSAGFPAVFVILSVAVSAGSLSWEKIVSSQGLWPHEWNAFHNPFLAISALIYLVVGNLIWVQKSLDSPLGSPELGRGIFRGETGVRSAVVRMSLRYAHFLWVLTGVGLYFGGWSLPSAVSHLLEPLGVGPLLFVEAALSCGKTVVIIVSIRAIEDLLPRLRSDQITNLSWRILGPVAVLSFMGSAFLGWWGQL